MPHSIWHLITPEYPPTCGGVSDYARNVAEGLRDRGDEVIVWCPPTGDVQPDWVHQIPAGMTLAGLVALNRQLETFSGPRRLLVQWVPHGFGYKSLNLPFCLWLWSRALKGDRVQIMLHEAFLKFGEGTWKQDLAAAVHRIMTIVLLRAASQVWMSTPAWESRWKRYALGRSVPFSWLPMPATIPVATPVLNGKLRATLLRPGQTLVGHFGTYGKNVAPLLERIALNLLGRRQEVVLMLLGRSGTEFRDQLIKASPSFADRIVASGLLAPEAVSQHISACDVLIQPFLDGANARRSSLIVGMAHGAAVVTTLGPMTETFWTTTDAVVAVPFENTQLFTNEVERLLDNPDQRERVKARSQAFYQEVFAPEAGFRLLRKSSDSSSSSSSLCQVQQKLP